MAKRVALFIDYQNVYMGARNAFFPDTPSHVDGQIHPTRLGLKVKGVGDDDRELVSVRVYRGMPSSERDPKGFGAAERQMALWEQQKLVTAIHRPLNYREPHRPREKGIDVRIAVDFVMMAQNDEYDVGVLFSGDTDLLPALEAVAMLDTGQTVEVACWRPDDGRSRPLSFDRRMGLEPLRCHYLDRRAYEHVADPTDYNAKRRRR